MASTADHVELVRQLRDLVRRRLLDPLEILLEYADAVESVRRQADADAEMWAAQILGPDDQLAVGVLARLVGALYPSDEPFDPSPDWWRTPLGRQAARRLGHPTRDHVSFATAGAMLGISKQGVADLVRRGKLARHPDGGVTVNSIRARLAQG